jgi:hypothetical protein
MSFTVQDVANAFTFVILPIVAVAAYYIGYDSGKTTGWFNCFMGRDIDGRQQCKQTKTTPRE